MGLISIITAFEIRMELDQIEIEDLDKMKPEAKQELETKSTKFFI